MRKMKRRRGEGGREIDGRMDEVTPPIRADS